MVLVYYMTIIPMLYGPLGYKRCLVSTKIQNYQVLRGGVVQGGQIPSCVRHSHPKPNPPPGSISQEPGTRTTLHPNIRYSTYLIYWRAYVLVQAVHSSLKGPMHKCCRLGSVSSLTSGLSKKLGGGAPNI